MKTLKRRRRNYQTDYAKRFKLLKGELPRIVFRKTNKYLISQYITSKQAKDKIVLGINSKLLLKYGWPKELENSLKTIPAAYLTGFLMGKRISKIKNKKSIVDFGMIRSVHQSKIYGFIKGLIDSGIELPFKKEIFPSDERIQGKHLKEDFSKIFNQIKSKIEKE